MTQHKGWIGVDLDGTLAFYDGWKGNVIGQPIPRMLRRVKAWLAEGEDVRILTARVNADGHNGETSVAAIKAWCLEHVGQELPVTCSKDMAMKVLWDDRAIGVVPNTGERTDGKNLNCYECGTEMVPYTACPSCNTENAG